MTNFYPLADCDGSISRRDASRNDFAAAHTAIGGNAAPQGPTHTIALPSTRTSTENTGFGTEVRHLNGYQANRFEQSDAPEKICSSVYDLFGDSRPLAEPDIQQNGTDAKYDDIGLQADTATTGSRTKTGLVDRQIALLEPEIHTTSSDDAEGEDDIDMTTDGELLYRDAEDQDLIDQMSVNDMLVDYQDNVVDQSTPTESRDIRDGEKPQPQTAISEISPLQSKPVSSPPETLPLQSEHISLSYSVSTPKATPATLMPSMNSLFTPLQSVHSLFTPPPSPSGSRPSKRFKLSHIAVPPLPPQVRKEEYRAMRVPNAVKRPKIRDPVTQALGPKRKKAASSSTRNDLDEFGQVRKKRKYTRRKLPDSEVPSSQSKKGPKMQNPSASAVRWPLKSVQRLWCPTIDPMDLPAIPYASLAASVRFVRPAIEWWRYQHVTCLPNPDKNKCFEPWCPFPQGPPSLPLFDELTLGPPLERHLDVQFELDGADTSFDGDESERFDTQYAGMEYSCKTPPPSRKAPREMIPTDLNVSETEGGPGLSATPMRNYQKTSRTLSKKALGKQKASNDEVELLPHLHSPRNSTSFSHDSPGLDHDALQYLKGWNIDNAPLLPSSTGPPNPSGSSFIDNITEVLPFGNDYDSNDGQRIERHLGSGVGDTVLETNHHAMLNPMHDPFLAGDEHMDQDGLMNPWSLPADERYLSHSSMEETSDSNGDFVGNGTIDPSLLGGNTFEDPQPQWPSLSPSPSSSVSPLASPATIRTKRREVDDLDLDYATEPSPPPTNYRKPSQRVSRPRINSDMVAIEDLDLSSREESDDEYRETTRNPPKKTLPVLPSPAQRNSSSEMDQPLSQRVTKIGPPRRRRGGRQENPRHAAAGISMCHQCRRATAYLKMQCVKIKRDGLVCAKRYCSRCVEIRYPNMTFDSKCRDFQCPACENTCNCTVCARKRGETYIGPRTGRHNGKRKPSVESDDENDLELPSRRRVKQPRTQPNISGPDIFSGTTQAFVGQPIQFWGAVYGVTGERLATAFTAADGENQVIIAQRVRPIASRQKPRKRRRVFIGAAQDWWKLDPENIKELAASSTSSKRTGKGKASDAPSGRAYIGKKWLLSAPRESADPLPSQTHFEDVGFSNRLTPLSDDSESDESEDGMMEETGTRILNAGISLNENDIANIIQMALATVT